MNRLETDILRHLEAGNPIALASIVSHAGSTPRTPGTRMAVLPDGTGLGTIGGGRLEAEVMTAAAAALAGGYGLIKRFELTGADASSMDMICGGRLDVLIEALLPDAATIGLFKAFAEAARQGQAAFWVVVLEPGRTEGSLAPRRALALRQAGGLTFLGAPPDETEPLTALVSAAERERCPVILPFGRRRVVIEPFQAAGRVWLFGAGHVAQQVARLAAMVDFRVAVLDDRPEFANAARFPEAETILVPGTFDAVMDDLPIDEGSYLVIVTRGHRYDLDLLDQALRTPAGYIGMIGSRRKRDAIYDALRRKGVADEAFARVRSPIGLDIGAETPEEIGLSIVAELVAARAGRRWSIPSAAALA
jgi:xanthine dehydrogenase accessory factor